VYSSGQAFAARIGLNDSCRSPVGTLPIGPRVEVMPDSSGGGSFGETVCTRCWTWRVAAPCGSKGYASRRALLAVTAKSRLEAGVLLAPPPPVVGSISCSRSPAVLCVMQAVAVAVVVAVTAEVGLRSQVAALAHQWRTAGLLLGRVSMVVVVALAQLTAVPFSQPLAWKVMAVGAVGPAPLPLGLPQLALALAQLGWTAWTLVARLDPLQPSPCRA
jgi:hypothetical protein